MTEQQRLTIRAELARRMGYSVVQSPYKEFRFYRLVSPNGERSGLCESETEAWSLAPDPSTDAADKDALVKWLKGQGNVVQANFWGELDLLINNPLLLIPVNGQLVYSPLEYLTLPLEAITLAAARALGIQEASEWHY